MHGSILVVIVVVVGLVVVVAWIKTSDSHVARALRQAVTASSQAFHALLQTRYPRRARFSWLKIRGFATWEIDAAEREVRDKKQEVAEARELITEAQEKVDDAQGKVTDAQVRLGKARARLGKLQERADEAE